MSNVYVELKLIVTGFSLTGLARGGQQVSKCKEMFGKAIDLLVQLASLQVTYCTSQFYCINFKDIFCHS